jgi:hypothetical protein
MGPEELALLEEELRARLWAKRWGRWKPYPWQVPPAEIPTLGWWLQLGGRGTGKTDGCARYVVSTSTARPATRGCAAGTASRSSPPRRETPLRRASTGRPGCGPRPARRPAHHHRRHVRPLAVRRRGEAVRRPHPRRRRAPPRRRQQVPGVDGGGRRDAPPQGGHHAQRDGPAHRRQPALHRVDHAEAAHRDDRADRSPDVTVTKGRTRDAIHLPEEQRHLIAKYAGTRMEAQELDGRSC